MSHTYFATKSPLLQVLTIILLSLGTFLILPSVLMMLGAYFLDLSLPTFFDQILHHRPIPRHQYVLLAIQAGTAFSSFILVPYWFIHKYEKHTLFHYFNRNHLFTLPLLLSGGVVMSMMMVNSPIVEWNMSISFPESIANVIDPMEAQNKKLTEYVTHFSSGLYFFCTLIVVALIPAVGEELLFRGLIQKYCTQIWKSPHIAIWFSAAFFSAFHLQFYGFFPRMILGAVFGYLFYFSGNLGYAIFGHFINNGFTLLMFYLFQNQVITTDIVNIPSISFSIWLLFVIITILLVVLFKKQFHLTINLENG